MLVLPENFNAPEGTKLIEIYPADLSGVEEIAGAQEEGRAVYFDMHSRKLGATVPTAAGIYVERCKGRSRKIMVR